MGTDERIYYQLFKNDKEQFAIGNERKPHLRAIQSLQPPTCVPVVPSVVCSLSTRCLNCPLCDDSPSSSNAPRGPGLGQAGPGLGANMKDYIHESRTTVVRYL